MKGKCRGDTTLFVTYDWAEVKWLSRGFWHEIETGGIIILVNGWSREDAAEEEERREEEDRKDRYAVKYMDDDDEDGEDGEDNDDEEDEEDEDEEEYDEVDMGGNE